MAQERIVTSEARPEEWDYANRAGTADEPVVKLGQGEYEHGFTPRVRLGNPMVPRLTYADVLLIVGVVLASASFGIASWNLFR
jgi:hypothetical protein